MSVLGIDQKLRRSFNKLKSYGSDRDQSVDEERMDTGIYLQTFLHHWDSCHRTFLQHEPKSGQVQDDIINVSAQLEQMIELLKYESTMCASTSIIDYILSENVLGELCAWTKSLPPPSIGTLLNLQIMLFEFLILDKERGITLLSHQTILRPLISVLELCQHMTSNFSEEALLGLVHSLSVIIMEQPDLIELFLSTSTSKKLILFSLLTPYLHKQGNLGQRAKESILIYISMSCKHKIIERVIGESNFCLILATGLSALFSALPSNLEFDHPDWHKLEMSDCQTIPELNALMSSIELCSAVIEVSPTSISSKLLDLIQTGFLNPIFAPALASDSESEVIAYTSYLNLLLAEVTADPLAVLIIRFLLTTKVEGRFLREILFTRINASSQVSVVTLALFETLLSYNIEDVMFCLIFQYLVPCTYLQPTYRDKICNPDPHGRASHKFLSLVPVSCDPPATPMTPRRTHLSTMTSSPSSISPRSLDSEGLISTSILNYDDYFREARQIIRTTVVDCLQWRNQYDGRDPYNQSIKRKVGKKSSLVNRQEKKGFQIERDPLEDNIEMFDGSNGGASLSGESSGYLSGNWDPDAELQEVTLSPEEEKEFWSAVGGSEVTKARLHSVLARIQHEDRLSLSSLGDDSHVSEDISPRPSTSGAAGAGVAAIGSNDDLSGRPVSQQPVLGPFLTNLLDRVQQFDKNSLNFNLRLTAIISKLSTYPQPLLRSVLSHPDVVLQPTCLTLTQAICTARARIDSITPGLLGSEEAVRQAKQFLLSRINSDMKEPNSGSITSITSLPATLGEYSRRGSRFLNLLGRRSGPTSPSQKPSAGPAIPPHTHRMAMAAVLLEEWLHELAAIAEAHTLLEHQAAILR